MRPLRRMKYNRINQKQEEHNMKKFVAFACGILAGFTAVMLYLHRGLIIAAIKGEELPEAPEGCPAYKG